MLIQPKIRGFVCITAHPDGCAAHIAEQIAVVKSRGPVANAPKRVLVVGSSTGYGLASRIAAAFGGSAKTIGVAFERAPEPDKCASTGWYNTAAFEAAAQKSGLYAKSFNGDAFSDAMKAQVFATIKKDWGQIDAFVYSLASPRRTHPKTGEQFRSVLKPIGKDFTAKNLDTDRRQIVDVTLTAATDEEIRQTVAVMGGEDWEFWIEGLKKEGLLAKNFVTLNYSYIGPEVTWPIYKDGTIGRAKRDLERAQKTISKSISSIGGRAFIGVLKAVVSQASSAIPVVPLYISLLFKLMKKAGTNEGQIEQIDRLWRGVSSNKLNLDAEGRIRIDNYEMEPSIQNEIKKLWPQVTTENLDQLGDFAGYQGDFLKLFGFGLKGVDYTKETDPMVRIPSIAPAAAPIKINA
jgi:enoyl-[acyl-carrier protein] reductase/trans-2-enoyl-CoA reductase (NAD+)